jgi:undecaprenyl-phosphate galactose phosphotransferase
MSKKLLANWIIAIADILVLIIVFYISLAIRVNLPQDIFPTVQDISIKDFGFIIFISFVMLVYENIYRFRYDFWQDTLNVIKALSISYILVLAILSLSKINLEYSRTFITIYFMTAVLIVPIAKRFTKKALFKGNKFFRINTLLIGDDIQTQKLAKELKDNWYLGQIPAQETSYDSVIIVSKNLSKNKLNSYIIKYTQNIKDVFIVPYVTQINFAHSNILELSNIRNNLIQIENKLLIKSNLFIKNLFDLIVSIIVLPIFLIIHIIISIAIKLDDSGSIFFKQQRLGKDGKVFEVYKYRTMYQDSDDILQQYLHNHPQEREYYQKYHKYTNDPRITKIGKFLRSTSLDELPQILNVLKGEMSLVGPRPYMLDEESLLYSAKHLILQVKPGITGLWQVSGRNNLTFQERTELESWYIKNWSLWFDFVIIVKTIKVVFLKVGAR